MSASFLDEKGRQRKRKRQKYTNLVYRSSVAPHSSTLAWKVPWTEEPGRLQSMGSLRVGHD